MLKIVLESPVIQPAKVLADKIGLLPTLKKLRAYRRYHAIRRNFQKLYAGFVEGGDLCFDVGANLGARTDAFLHLGAQVVAVEPQPSCIARLQSRFGRNERFTLVRGGLSESGGERDLYVCTHDAMTSMSPEWISHVQNRPKVVQFSWSQKITVQVYSMDDLIAKHGKPAFCKIDVEGFELQVLKGLSQPIKALSFECTPEFKELAYACIDYLLTLGTYRFNYSVGESAQLISPDWLDKTQFLALIAGLHSVENTGDIYAKLQS